MKALNSYSDTVKSIRCMKCGNMNKPKISHSPLDYIISIQIRSQKINKAQLLWVN